MKFSELKTGDVFEVVTNGNRAPFVMFVKNKHEVTRRFVKILDDGFTDSNGNTMGRAVDLIEFHAWAMWEDTEVSYVCEVFPFINNSGLQVYSGEVVTSMLEKA